MSKVQMPKHILRMVWKMQRMRCSAQRYFGKHLPTCLQPILKDKINALAKTVEMHMGEDERATIEHWQYVQKMDDA